MSLSGTYMVNPDVWRPAPTSAELTDRVLRDLNTLESRIEGLRAFAGAAFSGPLADVYQPLRETVATMKDNLFFAESDRDKAKALADGMHAALNLPVPRPDRYSYTRAPEPNPVKDVADMVARLGAAEEALKNALAENAKLNDRATVEWSNGQDARVAALEEGLRQLAREGLITRARSGKIRRAGYDALNRAASSSVVDLSGKRP